MSTKDRDNSTPAEDRGVPRKMRVYRVPIDSGDLVSGLATVILPYDIKVATIKSPVSADISLAKKEDEVSAPLPVDATNGTEPVKLPLEANVREPIAQEDEFNTLFIRPESASATELLIWIGGGENNYLTESGTVSA